MHRWGLELKLTTLLLKTLINRYLVWKERFVKLLLYPRFGTSQYMIVFCKFYWHHSIRSIFVWRPKEKSELVQPREEKKIIICGRSEKKSSSKKFKGESDDSDDDDTFSKAKGKNSKYKKTPSKSHSCTLKTK